MDAAVTTATTTKADAVGTEVNAAAAPVAFVPPFVASALLVVASGESISPAVLLSVGTVAQVRRR